MSDRSHVPGSPAAEVPAPAPAMGRTGERIGAYRVVAMIGTGGMGDVYKAVRDDDHYHAEVAIKVMRADVRDPLAEQRFLTERQILAALDHRNIARLLDGGTTTGGLPYVVMELVAGEPIDRYCDSRNLGVRERVQLFLQVCAAVAYAHQRLVVHRDLKPNNILVTADGSVRLLDFGIAKLLESEGPTLASKEPTVTQLRAMTLEYASPEQVRGGAVTTVSDVYSLGVVLYRLLTGQSPYGAQLNEAQRIAEILSDALPARPSLVKSTGRGGRGDIDVDLDNILLMALTKEPQRRYGTVDEFSGDLRNFLSGLPVVARRGTFGYRFGKYARRHKVEIGAGVTVIAALVGGLLFAIREARTAGQEREVAEAALNDEQGLDRALKEELGVTYRKLGDIQGDPHGDNTGDSKAALANYARSIELLRPLYLADPANRRLGARLGQTRLRLGAMYVERAGGANLSPETQLSYWRKAHDLLAQGIADLEKVSADLPLDATGQEVFDGGLVNLAKADSAIARLAGSP